MWYRGVNGVEIGFLGLLRGSGKVVSCRVIEMLSPSSQRSWRLLLSLYVWSDAGPVEGFSLVPMEALECSLLQVA